jgi:hypothetical protein
LHGGIRGLPGSGSNAQPGRITPTQFESWPSPSSRAGR